MHTSAYRPLLARFCAVPQGLRRCARHYPQRRMSPHKEEDAEHLQMLELVQAMAQQRSQAALSSLYDLTVQRVHGLVRRFVHDEAVAQEVTEDVFFQAWEQSARFDPQRGCVMAWLFTLARSRALDAWRRHNANPVTFDGELAEALSAGDAHERAEPADLLAQAQMGSVLHAALHSVSAPARQMLSLAYFQGQTHQEIALHLRAPLGTVKTTLRRALQQLRAYFLMHAPQLAQAYLPGELIGPEIGNEMGYDQTT